MSYIRCLTNPERLYIYQTDCSDHKGRSTTRVCIWQAPDKFDEALLIPIPIFEGLLTKWRDLCYTEQVVRYRGAALVELHNKPHQDQWRLEYRGWRKQDCPIAWLVTWMYIANNLDHK